MKKTGYALILIVLLFPAALPAPALKMAGTPQGRWKPIF